MRFDVKYKLQVASIAIIFALSLILTPRLTAQQCVDGDSTVVAWDTIAWAGTIDTFSWPLVEGMEDVEVIISFTPTLGSGTLDSDPNIVEDELIANFSPMAGEGLKPLEIKMKFNPPVRCLNFFISDIDHQEPTMGGSSGWTDSLYIFGNDTTLTPSLTAAAMTPSFTINGGEIVGNANDLGAGEGTVQVEFGGALVDSVTILYFDAMGAEAMVSRSIGISDSLSYSQESLLPVELLSYSIDKDENCHPMIKWETTHEYDLEYYAIEYSYDGINFSNAAIVRPQNTYTGVNRYEQILERKLNTDNYFRLVKKELDGSQSVLALDAIDGRGCFAFNGVNVYPNPAYKNYFYVEIESSDAKSSEIIIYDQTGRVISKADYALNAGNNWFKVSSKSFHPGTYFVQFKSDEEVVTRKVHIIH